MLILKILETICETGGETVDVIFSGYAGSYRKMRGINYDPNHKKIDYEKAERHRFSSLLFKLQKEGFVQKSKITGNKTILKITKKGLEKLNLLKSKEALPKITPTHQKEFLKVIIFDVPEKEKRKRQWLRVTLVNCGFEKLQKSVWVGEEKLPEDFFYHLDKLKLMPYVHIFAVSKRGSFNYRPSR